MEWYARNPRKFDMGTLGWSLAERGAYSCLVDAYYENEGPLPADEIAIAATLRVDLETWRVISGKVLGKFEVRDGLLFHEVCEKELATQRRLSERSRENGRKGGRPKRDETQQDKPTGLAAGNLEETQTKPQDRTGQDNTISSLRSDIGAEPALALEIPIAKQGKPKPVRGSRMIEGTKLPEAWALWARAEGHPDPQAEWAQFHDYWIAQPGQKAVKTNWEATWRSWVRRALSSGKPAVGRKPANGHAIVLSPAEQLKYLDGYVGHFKRFGEWHGKDQYRIEPGKPGCQVPPDILTKYGYTETGAKT